MQFGRMVLGMSAVGWLGFGVWLYANPLNLVEVGLTADTGLGRTEVRAFYGGLEIGIAAFLLWCALRRERTRIGLVAAMLTIGGTGLGRLSGIALEGFQTSTLMWVFVGIELGAASLTGYALRRLTLEEDGDS